MKLKKSIRLFLEDVRGRCAMKTHKTYCDRIKGLVALHGCQKIDRLSEEDVHTWLASLAGRDGGPPAPDTVRGSIVAVTQWQKFAIDAGHLAQPAFGPIKKPPGRRRERIPTRDEQARILRRADRAFAAIYRCLRYCGARPGELAGARIEQWDRSAGYLVIPQHKTARKTGRPRTIGVSPRMARIMDRACDVRPDGPIFLTRRGRPWSAGTLSQVFRRLRDAEKLSRDLVLYSVRHSVGTAVCEKFGIHAAAAVLGHATWKTTERYAHIGRHKLAEYQAIL